MNAPPLALVRLARPHQWVKNVFVVAPLFFTPSQVTGANVLRVAMAVAVFCLLSSAVYVINDWFDREADRQHPEKRHRPLASGAVSPAVGVAYAALLIGASATLAWTALPRSFFLIALLYFAINMAYSMALKHVSILDVMLIASGFVLRVDAGAAAIEVAPTVWIMICTGLLALFIALAKRRDDLVRDLAESHRKSLSGYNLKFIDASLAMVLGALVVSYLIYTVTARYGTDKLYLTAPFVIAGALRYLQITLVEERSGSPTELALTDRFLLASVAGWVAVFGGLIYL